MNGVRGAHPADAPRRKRPEWKNFDLVMNAQGMKQLRASHTNGHQAAKGGIQGKRRGWLSAAVALAAGLPLQAADIANWTPGTTPGNYNEPAHWDVGVVPLNTAARSYVVEIPGGAQVTYDVAGSGEVDAFRLGQDASFTLDGTRAFVVRGISILNGTVTVNGAGAVFRSDEAMATLGERARLVATAGGHISVAAPSFALANDWRAHRELLLADGAGSVLNLGSMKSLTAYGGWNGAWDYTVTARNGGVLDLSGLTTLTGPRTDTYNNNDFLTLRVQSGGTLKLDGLLKIQRRTRLIAEEDWTLPALQVVEQGWLLPAAGVTLDLPEFLRMEQGRVEVPDGTVINAPKLTALRNTTLVLEPGARINAPQVSDLSGSVIELEPGETVQFGTVSQVDRMSFTARVTPAFGFSAVSYALPADWREHRRILEADGAGVTLDVSSLNTITTEGGWNGAWNYTVTAKNGATLDLSGLTTAIGPRQNSFNRDDWLTFQVQNGGHLDLSSLSSVSRRVAFRPEAGEALALPALEEATGSVYFNILSGTTVDLPRLRRADGVRFDVDFAGRINAPALADLTGVSLNVQPGGVFEAPAVTDVSRSTLPLGGGESVTLGPINTLDGVSIVMSGPAPLTVTATNYALPADYQAHRAIFHANGAGANLDVSSLRTLRTEGAWGGAWDYFVQAENGGVVDLSGLVSAIGPRTDTYDHNDWLSFHLKNGGRIELSSLATVDRRVRFTAEESWTLPSLETVHQGYFYPEAGVTLDLPALREMNGGHMEIPNGAVINAPQAGAIRGTTLAVAPGGRLNAPRVRDVSDSVITLEAGAEILLGDIDTCDNLSLVARSTPAFTFSATSYHTPANRRGDRVLFTADGSGVTLDLGTLEEIETPGGDWGGHHYSITAKNDGALNLSGLRTIQGGRTDRYGRDDWLVLKSEVGGFLELGDATLSRQARIQVADSSARVKAATLRVQAPARLQAGDAGVLEITRGLSFQNTEPAQIDLTSGVVRFTGPGEHWLEVGGRDAGPTGFASGNFGIGRLEVGASGAPAALRLMDAWDNGNRGANGEPEALYLYGGLTLHAGSRLVIGDLHVYVSQGGAMVDLQSLLAGGDAAAFGDGVLARVGGPAIARMTPDAAVLPVVDHVDVTFNTPINPATFTTADVRLTGPGGVIPVTSVTALGGNDYRIAFPGQSDHGEIIVRVGPDIEDATGRLTQMDQNGNGAPGEADDAFEGRFLVDVRGPAVVSAVALRGGNLVGVRFDEPVEAASLADPANYAIAGVQPDPVTPRADGRSVALYFPPLTGDGFEIETVNLEDLLGNVVTTPQRFTGTMLPLSSVQVGNPTGLREAYTEDGSTFEIKAGGGTVWNNADHFQFYQEPRTGDFDVTLRVAAFSSPQYWARLGLMAREHAGANSRYLSIVAYQPNRENDYEFHRRLTQGGNTDKWANDVRGVSIPDGRLRLRREGNTFRAYTSTDGSNWTQRAETTFELPDTLLVGFFVSSEDWNLNSSATATIADWGDYSPAFVRQPQSQTVFQNQTARLLAEARGVGELTYQWYFNGNPLPGATAPTLELADIQPAQAGEYYVVAENAIGSVTSATATVVVDTSDPGAGFEADLMPRPAGDGTPGVSDWTMVGRMAVGLEAPANASEFARADCAPRATLGDGVISIADWSQAGRYAAGLDPKTAAGGPNGIDTLAVVTPATGHPAARALSLATADATGDRLRVAVRMRTMGDENSVGFSVRFDAAALRFEGATAGADAPGAVLFSNARAAAEGRIGVALALPAGGRLPTGELEVATLEFTRLTDGPVDVSFGNRPVALEAANALAGNLAVTPAAARFTVGLPEAGLWRAPEVRAGRVTLRFQGAPGARITLEASTDLRHWSAVEGPVTVPADGVAVFTQTMPGGARRMFYRARQAD